jgi:hypothetical protein
MNVNKRLNYFRTGLVLVISLFLLNLFLPSSFSQNGGGVARAGEPAMLEISGKVVKTMSGGGYTYALVDKDGAKTWVALPKSNIAVGNEITCRPGMTMYNFPSTALNRTFEQIVFSQGLKSSSSAAASPAATQATDEAADVPKPKAKKPIDDWKGGF